MVGRDGLVGGCAGFGTKRSTSRALVHIPGQCLWCEVETLTHAIVEYPALRSIVLAHEQALLCHTQQSAACNAVHKLQSRLARHLLRAADLHGRDEFPLTQDHLAEMLGARRTSVTLIASRFQKSGMINYKRGQIKVCNRAKLENAACELPGDKIKLPSDVSQSDPSNLGGGWWLDLVGAHPPSKLFRAAS